MRFYSQLMRQFSQAGRAYVLELWGNGGLLASRLAISSPSTLVMLKTTYDETQRELTSGRLLLHRTLAHLFEALPGKTIAFCTNADLNQLGWADRQRTIQHVTVHKHALILWAQRAAVATGQALSRGAQSKANGHLMPHELSIFKTVEALPAEELALLARDEALDISLGPRWLSNFERTVMAGIDGTRLLCLRRGGQVRAVLSMNVSPALSRFGGTVGALSNYYTTLWAPALEDGLAGIDLVPLFDALRRESGRLPVLQFSPMDPDAPSFTVLAEGLRAAGYRVEDYVAHGNWYLPVHGDWENYLANLTSKLRSNIKRASKKLEALGARTEIVSAPEDVDRAVDAYEAVYSKSWKQAEPVHGFMRELARTCAEAGWLRLGLLWLEDVPVAAQFWIISGTRAAIYKLAYDEKHKNLSPGTALTAQMMRMALELGQVREVDYLVGDDEYKRLWMTHRRERHGLLAYDLNTPKGMKRALVSAAGNWLRKRRAQRERQK
jgi:CelD/BcsL family acetyltransferase involved in cellulose biosynthesis